MVMCHEMSQVMPMVMLLNAATMSRLGQKSVSPTAAARFSAPAVLAGEVAGID